MKRHLDSMISILLIFSIAITGSTGYIQSELELRKFVPHKYFAYSTLILGFLHLTFKYKKLLNYLKQRT
jgi:DMSO/TMAO reductase YedYZ heme-binding membrane subunit